jgi:hypothetical protein
MQNAVQAITGHFVFVTLDLLEIHTQFVKNVSLKQTLEFWILTAQKPILHDLTESNYILFHSWLQKWLRMSTDTNMHQ